jgi:methylated-DNA-[protein]-cysteine S-methyltransferase
MAATLYATFESPIGELLLTGDGVALHALKMNGDGEYDALKDGLVRDQTAFADAIAQLEQYFAGERTEFDLDLAPQGTSFQMDVWRALSAIPYAETRSYGQIAAAVGRPKAARAVGGANNRNPIAVIVPCHRVIGADGTMVGYGGGLSRKTWLLGHEARERSANSSS